MSRRHSNGFCEIHNARCRVQLKPRQVGLRQEIRTLGLQRPSRSLRAGSVAEFDADTYCWTGIDEFTHLDDRKAEPPLPLPEIQSPKRIVLVRHGQSTWNAEGRIQGSTDFAVLTKKGQAQAATTYEMVCSDYQPDYYTTEEDAQLSMETSISCAVCQFPNYRIMQFAFSVNTIPPLFPNLGKTEHKCLHCEQ
jgi:hypothetical protein